MSKVGIIVAKVVGTLCGLVIIFGLMWFISGSSDIIMNSLKLYMGFAKANIKESLVFYTLLIAVTLVVEAIINKVISRTKGKKK